MHPDRLAQIAPTPRTKRPTTNTTTTTKRKSRRPNALPTSQLQPRKTASINATKARLRSVRRFLQKNGATMPADQQVALEREQQDLERQVREVALLGEGLGEERQQQQQQQEQVNERGQRQGIQEQKQQGQQMEQDNGVSKNMQKKKTNKAPRRTPKEEEMVRRYHKIRFFERKQATKHLSRSEAQLLSATTNSNPSADSADPTSSFNDTSDIQSLTQEVHNRKVDLLYTQYFPLLQPYSSLYVKPQNTSTNSTIAAPSPRPSSSSPSSSSIEAEAEPSSNTSDPAPNPNTHLTTTTIDKDKTAPKRSHPIWAQIEEHMQRGTLQQLRDGPLTTKHKANEATNGMNSKPTENATGTTRSPSANNSGLDAKNTPPPPPQRKKEPRNRREAREMARRERGAINTHNHPSRTKMGAAGGEPDIDQNGGDDGNGDGTQFFEFESIPIK